MRILFPTLLWLTVLSLSFVSAHEEEEQDVHEYEAGHGSTTESHTSNEWKDFVSFLHPSYVADKIQEGYQMPFNSLTDAFHDILRAGSAEEEAKPGSEADTGVPQSSPSDSATPPEPDPLQQALKALLSRDPSKLADTWGSLLNSTITLGSSFSTIIESSSFTNATADAINSTHIDVLTRKLATFLTITQEELLAKLPTPASAPGHAERARTVSASVEQAQEWILRLGMTYGFAESELEPHLLTVMPYAEQLGVLIGDVTELYPTAIEALVLNLSAVLLPEAVFIRSLVILYCFGPYVLGK
ncbi:hypothetical protein HYDPIDRAFT_116510, partial [Hydnomerulius pinastri MD-312]